MENLEKLEILKRAKKLFIEHPEYWGMCSCIRRSMLNIEYGICDISDEQVSAMFPEFNREFLEAPKSRYGRAYWWEPESKEGHDARIKAFNKLIKHYEDTGRN